MVALPEVWANCLVQSKPRLISWPIAERSKPLFWLWSRVSDLNRRPDD